MLVVALIGLIVAIFAVELKSVKPEFGTYLALTGGILLFSFILFRLAEMKQTLAAIQAYLPVKTTYLTLLFKMVGITYVAEFSAGICKDAGYPSMGNQIEIFGKLVILGLGMPVVLALLETINQILA